MNGCYLGRIDIIFFNNRLTCQITYSNNMICLIHTILFYGIDRRIYISPTPIEICRMYMYHQRLSGHLFSMNPCRISKPVMRMNHITRIGSGNHSGNNRIIIDFFQQVIRISTRKFYTSQIIKMHIIEICINMIPQIKIFLRIHISS